MSVTATILQSSALPGGAISGTYNGFEPTSLSFGGDIALVFSAADGTWTATINSDESSGPRPVVLTDGVNVVVAGAIDVQSAQATNWYYSNLSSFLAWNGTLSSTTESNKEGGTTIDINSINLAGIDGDAYINSRLKALGWTVLPLTGMDTDTITSMRAISNYACRWKLADQQNWGLYVAATNIDIEKASATGLLDKKRVDDFFTQIQDGDISITANGEPADEEEGTLPAPTASRTDYCPGIPLGHGFDVMPWG